MWYWDKLIYPSHSSKVMNQGDKIIDYEISNFISSWINLQTFNWSWWILKIVFDHHKNFPVIINTLYRTLYFIMRELSSFHLMNPTALPPHCPHSTKFRLLFPYWHLTYWEHLYYHFVKPELPFSYTTYWEHFHYHFVIPHYSFTTYSPPAGLKLGLSLIASWIRACRSSSNFFRIRNSRVFSRLPSLL